MLSSPNLLSPPLDAKSSFCQQGCGKHSEKACLVAIVGSLDLTFVL
jgi:hypothetical protein